MILKSKDLEKRYKTYSNIRTKVGREVEKGVLIPLKKGIYTDDPMAEPFVFANEICSPSYVSFESALALHGLIPKKSGKVFSATKSKSHTKEFVNQFGKFFYQDVPAKVYAKANAYYDAGTYVVLVASKEKAICDCLYRGEVILSIRELKKYLFQTLGIIEEEFWKLNLQQMLSLCPYYRSRSLNTLQKFIEKKLGIAHKGKKKKKKSISKADDAWEALAKFRNKYGE